MIYLIAFLAPLFYALSILIESFLSLDVFKKPSTMCFYTSLTNALFVPLMFCFEMPTCPHAPCFFIYIILAVIDIAYLYPYYHALKKTDTSVVSSLFALGKFFVPCLSFLILKDVLLPMQYVGFCIIIFASLVLSAKQGMFLKLNKSFYWMFLSSFLFSFRMVLAKLAIQSDGVWVNTIVYPNIISGILVFSFLLLKNLRPDIQKNMPAYKEKLPLFIVNEFVYFLAIAAATYALSWLSPVINGAIEATAPLFLLVLATIIQPFCRFQFKELQVSYAKKILCFILMIVGVILIA
ncbi:MAG: EamA family transporter [Alphaproteobacteria bacterium]|nr:EamA family transporter [Alphaproteobacteria bacterium]